MLFLVLVHGSTNVEDQYTMQELLCLDSKCTCSRADVLRSPSEVVVSLDVKFKADYCCSESRTDFQAMH